MFVIFESIFRYYYMPIVKVCIFYHISTILWISATSNTNYVIVSSMCILLTINMLTQFLSVPIYLHARGSKRFFCLVRKYHCALFLLFSYNISLIPVTDAPEIQNIPVTPLSTTSLRIHTFHHFFISLCNIVHCWNSKDEMYTAEFFWFFCLNIFPELPQTRHLYLNDSTYRHKSINSSVCDTSKPSCTVVLQRDGRFFSGLDPFAI